MPERPPWKREEEEEEEEEEELDEVNYIAQKDAVLFAIDVSETMLAPPPPSDDKKAEKDSPTTAAIKCAYQIMQQRIIFSPKDMMGVLLFGTEDSKFQDEDGNDRGNVYPHCYLLSDLNVPSAEDVKVLKAIVEEEEEAKSIFTPAKEPVSISNLLFCANQIFTTRAPNFGSRRLFIITDKDDPHANDKSLRSQAAVRAKDLYDLGVIIELFPISHPDHEFDRSKFYDDIIYRDPAEGEDLALAPSNFKSSGADGISLLANLISDINSKQVAKRALFSHLPFEIGPGFKISVKGYNILQKQAPARSCFIWLGGETAQVAEGVSEKMVEDTGRDVKSGDIKKAYKFGGSQVLFTPIEQQELKNFGAPILRIIGFKRQSMLPIWASVKKSTFIYPSEEDYIGSTRVFAALWQKLLKDKIMGVAWYIARKNASPMLVAILPSQERLDEAGVQVVPAGLWLYPLPFADDIRSNPEVPKPLLAPDNLVDEMRKVVQQVRMPVVDSRECWEHGPNFDEQLQLPKAIYDPSKYPNPSLQWHYKILQAMALEEEIPTIPEDKTEPKFRQIHKRAGEYISNWGIILDQQVRAYQKAQYGGIDGTKLKRDSEDAEEGGSRKRVKTEKSQTLGDMSTDDLKKLVKRGDLGKRTIPELKELLKNKGMSTSGKKTDLVDRIEAWVEDN